MQLSPWAGSLAALSAVIAAVACSNYNAPPSGPTGDFSGVAVNPNASAVVTLTFPSADMASRTPDEPRFSLVRSAFAAGGTQVTGSLAIVGGATVPLSGTYYGSSNPQLSVAGSGYTLTGNYTASNSTIAGTFLTPGSSTSGGWTVHIATTMNYVFCGTYAENGTPIGAFDFLISGDLLTGSADQLNDGASALLSGTYDPSGTAVSIMYADGSATGTADLGAGTASGTFAGISGSGTWSGTVAGCTP